MLSKCISCPNVIIQIIGISCFHVFDVIVSCHGCGEGSGYRRYPRYQKRIAAPVDAARW